MATLEEEIRKLEQKIDDLDREYQDAGSEERKDIRPLITAKETRLNTLLQQRREQQQQQHQQLQGKTIILAYQFNIAALKLILSLGSPLISLSCSLLFVI
jgi:septal ring factor EnvC (AmiA/AmiB activator)